MKVTFMVEQTVDLKLLKVSAEARYWEDAEINGVSDENGDLTPCRVGDCWCPEIDIETGKILNWEQGKKASIHFKTCDSFECKLIDSNGKVWHEYQGYVPKTMSPKENSFGDYIIMDIDENGLIQKWKFNFDDFDNDN